MQKRYICFVAVKIYAQHTGHSVCTQCRFMLHSYMSCSMICRWAYCQFIHSNTKFDIACYMHQLFISFSVTYRTCLIDKLIYISHYNFWAGKITRVQHEWGKFVSSLFSKIEEINISYPLIRDNNAQLQKWYQITLQHGTVLNPLSDELFHLSWDCFVHDTWSEVWLKDSLGQVG